MSGLGGIRRRTSRVAPDINVTPLVDVVLVLLIIFMVVAPHMDQDIQVNLPGIFNPDPDVEGQRAPQTVTITRGGEIFIEGQAYDLDAAATKLAEIHAADPMKRLALRADAGVQYGQMRPIFARLREIGFPGTNLMVGHRTGQQPGVPSGSEPAAAEADAAPALPAGAPPADAAAPAAGG